MPATQCRGRFADLDEWMVNSWNNVASRDSWRLPSRPMRSRRARSTQHLGGSSLDGSDPGPPSMPVRSHQAAPAVRRLLAMEIVSGLGDGIFWVGLVWFLIDRGTGSVGLAVAAAARLGPRALLGASAGVLADRVDRKRLLVGLDLARSITTLALSVAIANGAGVPVVIAGVFVTYTFAAPYRPALTAALPAVVGEGKLASANAMVATTRQVMTFVGPIFGAALMSSGAPAVAFGLNAASFVASALLIGSVAGLGGAVRQLRPGARTQRSPWRTEAAEGWSEITGAPGLSTVIALVFVMYAVRGAEIILLVLIADDQLGLGSAGVGLLLGAIGLGALAALPFANRIADFRNPGLVVTASVVMTGLPLIALSQTRSPFVALAVLAVLGVGVVAFELLSTVLLQRLTQRDRLGRVFGLVGSASNGGKLAGAILAPAVVAVAGLEATTAACGVALCVAALASTPRLRALTALTADRRRVLEPRVQVLASLELFAGASRQTLEMLAAYVATEQVAAGSVVIREGESADDLYVIRDGTFDVYVGAHQFSTMGPGQWFGEIGLLHHRPRTATVSASTAATVWRIPGTVFLDALYHGASEPTALVEVMAERLARAS